MAVRVSNSLLEQPFNDHFKNSKEKIGFGRNCHWCTEAIFQSLKGVEKVEQGWISSFGEDKSLSEGVSVHFDKNRIDPLPIL